MPLGDSITMGAGSRRGDGYRTDLFRALTRSGLRVDFVGSRHDGAGPDPDHEGHSGWTMSRLSDHLDGWLSRSRPDVILLHAGTNDLRTPTGAARAPQRLARLLLQISRGRPHAEVYVAKIIGNADREDGPLRQQRADAYNAQVPGVVAAAGPHFHVVDLSGVRGGGDMADKLHPNDTGYARMAAGWSTALLAQF
ncbi:SGNH/GDSL hydrolase family protein [Symbioplanes lichenis]|uniref:SGNH/GDSL hydrolase family protein n=1 Tax=Symbioplanes lichenis TaxID=1629072 RepID=UPI0027390649|nr:SGNH/GDSL hydrolase family protein [Actinoplanes lichenis]